MGILKKITTGILAALLAVSTFSGCSGGGEISSGAAAKDFPVTVENVTLKSEPEGVAVFSPNLADVILAMGYEVSLKAKSADCDQSDLSVLPNVTASDAQAVRKTGATLALFEKDPGEDTRSALSKEGISSIVIAPAVSREDLERLYEEAGAALKGGSTGYKKGQKTAQDIFMTVDDITRVVPQSSSPVTVCYLYDAKGAAATGDMLAGKLIECAGLVNGVASSTNGKADAQTLKIANPQYIFCPTGVKKELEESADYKNLTAVQKGKVYEMDPSYMARQGRGMIQAVSFMAGTVYPELLQGSSSESGGESSASSGGTSVPTGQTLKSGDKGDAVKALQTRLDELGYMFVPVSGEYTAATVQAVKDFQYLNGMTVTGIADSETQQKLNSSDAKKREN